MSRPPRTPWAPLTAWLEEARDFAIANVPIQSLNTRTTRTGRGTAITAQAEESTPATPPKPYLLTAIKDNHLLCQPMILNDAGDALEPDASADATYIAKPPGLWMKGWDGEEVDGITYQFLDDLSPGVIDSTKRTATTNSPAVTEAQRIVPRYVEGFSIIYAVKVSALGLTVETDPGNPPATPPTIEQITLLDINTDGRAWAREDDAA